MKITQLNQFEELNTTEILFISRFCREIKEPRLNLLLASYDFCVPPNATLWFCRKSNKGIQAFMWATKRNGEDHMFVFQIEAVYITPTTRINSREIFSAFEKRGEEYARTNGCTSMGFYTRRNPHAFIRTLNRTAPKKWSIDSHVLTRPI